MKISARNQLMGRVVAFEKGAVNSVVKIELTGAPVITSVITNEAAEQLGLALDGQACAVVKASSVMVGVCGAGEACDCQK